MLNLETLAARPTTTTPFPHLTAEGLLSDGDKAALAADFPQEKKTGFFPVEQLSYGPAFEQLLVNRPQMIVVRKWSALKDGNPHTDGMDKVATALVYLNDDWSDQGGALRFLEGPDLDGPGTAPIPARYGAFAAFARADDSWHGHKPFAGERRVLQVFWLVDAAAAERKNRRHKRTNFFKAIWAGRAA
jgi:SM-20-related protein